MEEFTTLQLLSESFEGTLLQLLKKEDNKIAKYLLDAAQIIKIYSDIRTKYSESQFPSYGSFLKEYLNIIEGKITDFGRQLTLKKDTFEVSFLPKGCIPEYTATGKWAKKNRQSGKPGKIIQKVIGTGVFSNYDYEKFVYSLKALWSNGGYDIKLVKGEDIRYWYNSDNYYAITSTLGNSCMSHEECADYFDLYCKQPECEMLIALKEGKLAARALVWNIEKKTFMDRVYYIEDSLYNIFTNYAKEHKWYIRKDNCLLTDGDDQSFLSPEDNYVDPVQEHFVLHLNKIYSKWPYIDTFRYIDLDAKILTTYWSSYARCCSHTDGSFDDLVSDVFYCENCGEEYDTEDELVYSDYFEYQGCTSCMTYSDIMDDYIPNSEAIPVTRNSYNDICCASYLSRHSEDFVLIDRHWYTTDCTDIYKDEQGEWKLK